MTLLKLSPLQQKAYDIALNKDVGVKRIVGYAGTGKTTVLALVAKEYGSDCIVLAPTNKAAIVLREKGVDAKTIHSYLYSPSEVEVKKTDKDGNIIYHKDGDGNDIVDGNGEKVAVIAKKQMQFSLKQHQIGMPKIALIDEASMVGDDIFNDLCQSFETIILFGDGFQLPPVNDKDVLNSFKPDIFLDEVHRVALENPIIRFATEIRNGNDPDIHEYAKNCTNKEIGFCRWNNSKLFKAINEHNVQVICATNRTRHALNDSIRREKGYDPNTIVVGEQIVCLENWRETIYNEDGDKFRKLIFYNGQQLESGQNHNQTDNNFKPVLTSIKENGQKFLLPFWNKGFFNIADNGNKWWNEYKKMKAVTPGLFRGIKMDYSYAITAHKAQGSEYDNVAVFDERPKIKRDRQRWYYTAVTRAKKRLLIVRDC